MPKLTVDTKGSLYEPIEVEIDGKVYRVKPLTRELLQQIDAFDKAEAKGVVEATYKRLETMIDGIGNKLDKLDIREIHRLTDFILTSLQPQKEEKNESGPGSGKLPS